MAAANQVRVSGSLYLPWVLVKSKERNYSSKFTAMIRVKAPPSVRRSNAAPIHLVVVLDVCARMGQQEAGPRLLDLLKMMEFIRGEFRRKTAAKDRIDVVDAFDDQTTTTTIDGWISAAQGNEENLVRRRQTELSLILDRAVEILDKSKQSSGDVKRVGFILLLSDGQRKLKFNKSVNNLLSKYPVHAFGLGSNHDPEMLHCIAKTSRGTYSSIADADADADAENNNLNSSSKLMEAVALCLGGLKSVVAINTRVRIRVELDRSSDSLMEEDDIEIKIQPGAHDISASNEGFPVGDGVLYAGEVKDLIVDINFSTVKISSRTRPATLTATVEYEDSSHKEGPPVQCNLPLLVTGTSNRPAMRAYGKLEEFLPNSMVLQRMIMLEVLEKLVKFAKDNLKTTTTTTTTTTTRPLPPPPKKTTTSTTATRPPPPKKTTTSTTSTRPPPTKKTTTTTNAPTPTTGKLLRSMWDELKKQGKNLKVAQKISDLIDLRGIDNDMEAMASCLQREGVSSGLSCIYSWVSSYQMQRATTTGLPPPAPATPFLTPAMEAMVHNARNKQLVAQKPPSSPPVQEGAAETDKQDDTVAQKKEPPSPSPPVVQEEGAVETVVKQDDTVAQKEPLPSPPVQPSAVEMGKQQDDTVVPLSPPVQTDTVETGKQNDIQLVAQEEPLPPSVQKDAMKTPSTGNEKRPPAQPVTTLDDEKSKVAIRLIEYIDNQFRSYESYAQPFGLHMSKGGQMFQRHTTDLDFLKNKIYEAAEKAIDEWGRLNTTSDSGN